MPGIGKKNDAGYIPHLGVDKYTDFIKTTYESKKGAYLGKVFRHLADNMEKTFLQIKNYFSKGTSTQNKKVWVSNQRIVSKIEKKVEKIEKALKLGILDLNGKEYIEKGLDKMSEICNLLKNGAGVDLAGLKTLSDRIAQMQLKDSSLNFKKDSETILSDKNVKTNPTNTINFNAIKPKTIKNKDTKYNTTLPYQKQIQEGAHPMSEEEGKKDIDLKQPQIKEVGGNKDVGGDKTEKNVKVKNKEERGERLKSLTTNRPRKMSHMRAVQEETKNDLPKLPKL